MIFNFKQGFDDNHSLSFDQRPLIAISANIIDENSALHFAYSQAIINAGGVPIVIPANCDAQALWSLMRSIDGVLFSGGADIDAQYFGEENIPDLTEIDPLRDSYEFMLLRAAINCGVPILGICRGCQLINVALGGTIYQDLPSMYPNEVVAHSILTNRERPVHNISITEGTVLHKIVGKDNIGVNSRHHQAIKNIAPGLKITAVSDDGVIEAIEAYPTHKIIALQCHPENLATKGDSVEMQRLFSFLISEANLYRRAKRIHLSNPIVDSHCDTPMLYEKGKFNFAVRNSNALVDIVKMQEGYVDTTITVAYLPQSTAAECANEKAHSIITKFKEDLAKIEDKIAIVRSVEELKDAKHRGLKSVMLGIENGLAIGNELSNIDRFKDEGVIYITLCHNGANHICDSAKGEIIHDGVSQFGKEVIARMNKLGITVDISHSSEKSTLDALELSSQPIIASHSSCKVLCNHPRNLSDDAIKLIARKGGVVQVCCYNEFLKENGGADIHNIVEHIEHVIKLTGYNNVGVGSDFDGDGGVPGFEGANHFINLTVELLRRGHSEENIAKIMGGNILRVLESNYKN